LKTLNLISDYFIDTRRNYSLNKRRKVRFFVLSQVFIFLLIFFGLCINRNELLSSSTPFPFEIFLGGILFNLFFFKYTQKFVFLVNTFLSLCAISMFYSARSSGGIYSDDIFWIVNIPLIALLLLDFKFGVIWTAVCSLIVILLYNYSIDKSDILINKILDNGPDYYLFGSILFFILLMGISSIFKLQSDAYENKLIDQKMKLSKQKQMLKNKTNELKKTQKALENSNTELEKYAYITSHDLKQPLRTIKSFTTLIQKGLMSKNLLDKEINEYINFVVKSTDNMNELIGSLLEYARINNNELNEFVEIDLNYTLNVVKHNLHNQIQESSATIISDNLPEVKAIPVKINQLFQNVISNAIKFSRENIPPIIQISARSFPGYWKFIISDNGTGISSEDIERIFEPFERSSSTKTKPGSGIGLATCKKIVELHQGEIKAISNGIKQGTTFEFTIHKKIKTAMKA